MGTGYPWVVHLWVEGFFEVFATVVIAFLFTRLKLIEIRTATRAALFSTSIFLAGGIVGTFHHLYFAGATPAVIALGAIFSALEVVPLTLVGYEAWENIRLAQPMNKGKRLRRAVLTHVGGACDCGRSCPQISSGHNLREKLLSILRKDCLARYCSQQESFRVPALP